MAYDFEKDFARPMEELLNELRLEQHKDAPTSTNGATDASDIEELDEWVAAGSIDVKKSWKILRRALISPNGRLGE